MHQRAGRGRILLQTSDHQQELSRRRDAAVARASRQSIHDPFRGAWCVETGLSEGFGGGFDDGFGGGFSDGFDDGFGGGFSDGFDDGFGGGFSDGFDDGFGGGFSDGFDDGFDDGFGGGFSDGFDDGFGGGFSDGFDDGFGRVRRAAGASVAGASPPSGDPSSALAPPEPQATYAPRKTAATSVVLSSQLRRFRDCCPLTALRPTLPPSVEPLADLEVPVSPGENVHDVVKGRGFRIQIIPRYGMGRFSSGSRPRRNAVTTTSMALWQRSFSRRCLMWSRHVAALMPRQ